MPRYRDRLPMLDDRIFLTDGGMETTFIFHDGIELPCFASFTLLTHDDGRRRLAGYLERYAEIALRQRVGFVLESPTWRASADWGERLGFTPEALDAVNREAIDFLVALRDRLATADTPMVVAGCVGPRGDGYARSTAMSAEAAAEYHARQIGVFAASEADLVTAMTLNSVPEAIGIVRAAQAAGIPVAVSFTVETDGRLPSGTALGEAIEEVDAATGAAAAYFMINCAHPAHFDATLAGGGAWLGRLRGIRANASRLSHAELDNATELDAGDPADLGRRYRELRRRLPRLSVLGGCCGTDHRHVAAICAACLEPA